MAKRTVLITTPIFYVNGPPHIGHASTVLLADTLARWHRMCGRKVLFVTGTDEHGSKVEKAAQQRGLPVKSFCDEVSQTFRSLAEGLSCSHDVFIRTTDEHHKQTVRHIWKRLSDAGLLRKDSYSGYYSQPDECFVPPSRILLREDGKRVSAESGHVLEWLQEDNFVFPVGKFVSDIRTWASGPGAIIPDDQQRQVVQHMLSDEALGDLSVSRPRSRVQWGIPVPGEETEHVVYVWLDALFNYLSAAGFDGTPESIAGVWPPDTQIVGKDILRFHAVYWPAFLKGASLELPKRLVSHGHWIVNGMKMSKSLGNVLDPWPLIDTYGSDALRYYLLSEMNLSGDSSFSLDALREKTYADLADSYGNLVKRCTAKSINPSRKVQSVPMSELSRERPLQEARMLKSVLNDRIPNMDYRACLTACMDVIRAGNKYWEDQKPWTLKNNKDQLDKVVLTTLETVRVVSTALSPFIPKATDRILAELGVSESGRGIDGLDVASTHTANMIGRDLSGFDSFLVMAKKKQ